MKRVLLGCVMLLILGVGAAVYTLPRYLTQQVRTMGYPEAVVALNWRNPMSVGVQVKAKADDAQPFVEMQVEPWSRGQLRISHLHVIQWIAPQGMQQDVDKKWWQQRFSLPQMPYATLVLEDVAISLGQIGHLQGEMTLTPHQGKKGWWIATLDYDVPEQMLSGAASVTVANDGSWTLGVEAEKSLSQDDTLSGTFTLEAGRDEPIISGQMSNAGWNVALNPEHKPGFVWPISIKIDPPMMDVAQVDGRVTLQGDGLQVLSAKAEALGGVIGVKPFVVPFGASEIAATLVLTKIDLAQALRVVSVDGLNGTGQLSGTLPVRFAGGKLSFGQGTATALETGTITYNPANPPSFLAEGGQGAILAQVFSDFRYKTLHFALDGGDTLTLATKIEGSNPSFYDGHPVSFNLTLSGDLDTVLQQGLRGLHLTPDALKALVKEGQKP